MWLWLSSIPVAIFENYELSSMTLKYRRKCSQFDALQSMCSPTSCTAKLEKEAKVKVNGAGCSYTVRSQTSIPVVAKCVPPHLQFIHLLRLQVDGAEILQGKTQWRLKKSKHLH
jgi:fatty acyl-ACP thioesterase B